MRIGAIVLLLLPAPALADLSIDGPSQVAPYRMARLKARGAEQGAALIWDVYPEEAADITELPGGRLEFVAPPGTYRVKLRSIKGDSVETARLTVTIGGEPGPGPPSPPPDPKPKPPEPPSDPLTRELQVLYAADADPGKAQALARLAALYKLAAAKAADRSVVTVGDLVGAVSAAASDLSRDALKALRARVKVEVDGAMLPTDPSTPLSDEARLKIASVYSRVANALGGIGK